MTTAARAYLSQPADDRLETRLPRRLKHDAEAVARAHGQTLSQLVLEALAERVSADYAATQQWHLTPGETAALLQNLALSADEPAPLTAARDRAVAMLGENPR